MGVLEGEGPLRFSLVGESLSAFLSLSNLPVVMALPKTFASLRLTDSPPYPLAMSLATDPSHSTCLTEACIRVAGKILESLDRGVSPCEDFYQFSCGGWIRRNPLPDGRSRWNTFNSLWDQNQAVLKHLLGEWACQGGAVASTCLAPSTEPGT